MLPQKWAGCRLPVHSAPNRVLTGAWEAGAGAASAHLPRQPDPGAHSHGTPFVCRKTKRTEKELALGVTVLFLVFFVKLLDCI